MLQRHNQPTIVSVRAISSLVPSDDSHILEQLRLDVERHSMSALASLKGWSVLRPGSQIRQASATKISIVSSERQLMPFHSSDITSALWRSVRETCVKHNRFYQQVQHRNACRRSICKGLTLLRGFAYREWRRRTEPC